MSTVGEVTSYRELGVRRVVNAASTLTRLGGSIMPPVAVEAMVQASREFVDLYELQQKVGERLAELTRNEAAYVSSGAAAGIMLSVTACMVGTSSERMAVLPDTSSLPRNEVIIHRVQRNGYDFAAQQTGARIVEIEGTPEALREALGERTACVLFFAGAHYATGAIPLETVVEIAHERGVPVIVDGAAQVPVLSNLWHFTRDLGADIAIFSGGKGLRGPQPSGLVVGRRELIEGCRANGSPNHGIGRPMKVGKEEMMGLLAAVEWSLEQDEPAMFAAYEASVALWLDGLAGIPGVRAERVFPHSLGHPYGYAVVHIGPDAAVTRDEAVAALWDQDPRIAVSPRGTDAISLGPQPLQPGDDAIVLRGLQEVLGGYLP